MFWSKHMILTYDFKVVIDIFTVYYEYLQIPYERNFKLSKLTKSQLKKKIIYRNCFDIKEKKNFHNN